jgi:DNA replication protein DnaC
MTATDTIDAGRLSLALTDLRLPAIKLVWPDLAARADKEGWPAARFLAALAEHEMAERANRRIRRHLEEARLPPDKTIDSFDFEAVPMVSKAQVMALAAGDSWLKAGAIDPARAVLESDWWLPISWRWTIGTCGA